MSYKTFIPKDPVIIGKTPNGEPIWLRPETLIPTPDEELERVHNTKRDRESMFVCKMAAAVIENAGAFSEQTFLKTASREGINVYMSGNQEAIAQWMRSAGYETVQDGLVTIQKIGGKVVREMTAEIPLPHKEAVAKKVMELIRKSPSDS